LAGRGEGVAHVARVGHRFRQGIDFFYWPRGLRSQTGFFAVRAFVFRFVEALEKRDVFGEVFGGFGIGGDDDPERVLCMRGD